MWFEFGAFTFPELHFIFHIFQNKRIFFFTVHKFKQKKNI